MRGPRPPAPAEISGVRPGSLAALAGIAPGDSIVTLGGRVLRDVVDLQFYQAEPEVEALIRRPGGHEERILFEKHPDEDLGFEFDRPTWDDVTLCNNNCFFCFLKGLPKGMRRTLYIKDDDYRLSFLHGNFVTLTNLTDEDWARLEEQRLSPLNVSVHATDLALRRSMLANPSAPDILEQLDRLATLRLRAHTQIVLCPGVNDGAALDRSIADLLARYPAVQTISVVPVGASPKLEDWSLARDGIELVRPSAGYARAVVHQLRPWQRKARREHGATILHCSDEYYVTAGITPPAARSYDGFPQYENGVGMVRRLLDDEARVVRRLPANAGRPDARRVIVACGTLIAPLLAESAPRIAIRTGATIEVRPIPNSVFGERVNVSGLLCGADIVTALAGVSRDLVVLPRAALDYFGQRFLDDMTIAEVEARLGCPVAFASRWSEVVRILSRPMVERPTNNAASNGAFWSETPARSSR